MTPGRFGILGFGMRKFKAFGTRRNFDKDSSDTSSSPQCFPHFYSPARDSFHRRRSVDGRVADARESTTTDAASAMRRRSVDDSRSGESVDLQAVRKEWKSNSCAAVSSSDSFSSSLSSSRPSDASAMSADGLRDGLREHRGVGAEVLERVVVVGFDANTKEGGVGVTVMWAFQNTGMQRGDVLVLLGVVDTVRGPLGYKVQVSDQTWLGASRKFLEEDAKAKNLAWSREFPLLRKRCSDAGVTLQVHVKASQQPHLAIVHEATSRGAVHVVLDKSLHNKRRRYYQEHLACEVTRMRRSGGVDTIRPRDSHNNPSSSPTSVLPQRPPAPAPRNSFNSNLGSNLSRLVKLTDEKQSSVSNSARRQSCNPTIDEEELFCIDHDFLTRRVEMLLEPEADLGDDGRRDQLIVDDGYESDDLFSLAGDGASRRPSLAFFAMESARNSMRSSISRITQLATG